MTAQEVRDMIAKSKERVKQLRALDMSKDTLGARIYHEGFQDALMQVLIKVEQEELIEMTKPKGRS